MNTTLLRASIPGPPVAVPSSSARVSNSLLLASRRLDWRFLLPDPRLGKVLYMGPARGPLVESLRRFCSSLTVTDDARQPGNRAMDFDVVVVGSASREILSPVVERMAPSGWLYVEAHRRPRPGLLRRAVGVRFHSQTPPLYHAADYVAALRRLGLTEVEAHWHWPDLETCAEMVPLGDRAALARTLARRAGGPAARLKAALGRGLLKAELLARLVPCFSVVAHKPSQQASPSCDTSDRQLTKVTSNTVE